MTTHNTSRPQKVGITGAAGFIGSHLADRLLAEGIAVVGLDNFSQGFRRNLKEAGQRKNFSLAEGDILDRPLVKRAFADCEAIIHLAAYKIPRYSSALNTLIVNTHGTENVLECARETGARVLIASTSDVYGKNPDLPFTEEHNLVLGSSRVRRWAYAASKIFDEHLAFAYEEEFKIPVTLFRFFGAYGPRQHPTWWGGPQSVFIKAAMRNEVIPIHGDGRQTRTFIFVSDLVEGIAGSLFSEETKGEILNLGGTREITIEGLARMIWQIVRPHDPPRLEFHPYSSFGRYEDVLRRVPDLTKARSLIGFDPQTPLEEGLARTYQWQSALNEDEP